jgi:hypothetical protein
MGRVGSVMRLQPNVQTLGGLTTLEQFGNILIKSDNNGHVTRIRDVARVGTVAVGLHANLPNAELFRSNADGRIHRTRNTGSGANAELGSHCVLECDRRRLRQ